MHSLVREWSTQWKAAGDTTAVNVQESGKVKEDLFRTGLTQSKIHFHSSCDLIWPLAWVPFSFTGLVLQHFEKCFLGGLDSWQTLDLLAGDESLFQESWSLLRWAWEPQPYWSSQCFPWVPVLWCEASICCSNHQPEGRGLSFFKIYPYPAV